MSFTFILAREYNLGVQQLLAILNDAQVPCRLIFSRYSGFEIGYLQHMCSSATPAKRARAHELLSEDRAQILAQLDEEQAVVLGFSVTTDLYQLWISIAAEVKTKHPRLPIVMGGVHPTILPERVISRNCVDAVYVGEAEKTIVDIYRFLAGASDDHPTGLWIKDNKTIVQSNPSRLIENLDDLPFQEVAPFVAAVPSLGQVYQVGTSRGCPFDCSYCIAGNLKHLYADSGHYLRRRSPGHVLNELKSAQSKWPLSSVDFIDDVFTIDLAWLNEFLSRYKAEVGLPFRCLIHPATVQREILRAVRLAGCQGIKMGVQHVNPELCLRVFNRKFDSEKVKHVTEWATELDLPIKLDFIIGAPTETEQDLVHMAQFLREMKVSDIFLYFLTYYPGAKILEYARKNGDLSEAQVEDVLEGRVTSFQFIPDRFQGARRELYEKYNRIIREAAGSHIMTDHFAYLLV